MVPSYWRARRVATIAGDSSPTLAQYRDYIPDVVPSLLPMRLMHPPSLHAPSSSGRRSGRTLGECVGGKVVERMKATVAR